MVFLSSGAETSQWTKERVNLLTNSRSSQLAGQYVFKDYICIEFSTKGHIVHA